MRKYLFLSMIVTLSFVLFGCNDETNSLDEVTVILPAGGPAVALMEMYNDDELMIDEIDIVIDKPVNGPDKLISAITSESHDVVIAPTNVGAMLYNKDSGYRFAGTVAWGNLYLVSKQNHTFDDLENKTIVAFAKNSTPDIILQLVLKQHNLKVGQNITVVYKDSVSEVNAAFLTGQYDYALLAEPVLTAAKMKLKTSETAVDKTIYTIGDLQTEWKSITNNDSYPQAGIFINETLIEEHEDVVEQLVARIKTSVDFANSEENYVSVGAYYEEADLGLKAGIIKQSIPGLNVRYSSATDSKTALEDYFNEILDFNGKLIGNSLPDDDFYYDPEK